TINNNTGIDNQSTCDSLTWIDGNTYTSSTNTPTYTFTNVNGCDSVVNLDLTINNSNTGTDFQTACGTYTWIDGNTYTASTNTPTYNLTNTFGCDSVIILDLTLNMVDNGITNNSPILTANAIGATYQWLDCNNNYAPIPVEINQSFTATANGSYAVEVTQNGCVDTSACEQVNNVGVNEINSRITLHPNPTTGIVELQGINGSFKVDVYDYAGKFLQSTDHSTIDLSDYPKGIYLLKVAYFDRVEQLKLVKE
ncbi:MAG: T9SS type A sorting domain-containing protein, partial [Flavobacteriales bacterium]|nr:T9SS type A sorting domain-containing protein [Flavobacteriales bacterium]